MNSGMSMILKKNQLKMSFNFLSQLSLQYHSLQAEINKYEIYFISLMLSNDIIE